jgi:hypothetical protein
LSPDDQALVDDYIRRRLAALNSKSDSDLGAKKANESQPESEENDHVSPISRSARAWNASRGIEGWPQQQLIEPPLKVKEGPRWEDFPEQLQADIASHLKFLATHRKSPSGKHLRPCKATTLRTRRTDLISFAKKAVRLGTPMEELCSLSVLLAPDLVERILDKEWEQNGDEPKTSTIDLAKKLVAVARAANLPHQGADR